MGMLTYLVINTAITSVALVDGASLLAGAGVVVQDATSFTDDGDGTVFLLPMQTLERV